MTPLPAVIPATFNDWNAFYAAPYYISGTTTHTAETALVTGPANVTAAKVTVRFYTGNRVQGYVYKYTIRWRIMYRINGTSTWNYSSWSSITSQTSTTFQTLTQSLNVSLTAGQYQFAVQWEMVFTGRISVSVGANDYPWIEITEIAVTKAGGAQLATGSVNFIAIGE